MIQGLQAPQSHPFLTQADAAVHRHLEGQQLAVNEHLQFPGRIIRALDDPFGL
jgi:hypothetical protein